MPFVPWVEVEDIYHMVPSQSLGLKHLVGLVICCLEELVKVEVAELWAASRFI